MHSKSFVCPVGRAGIENQSEEQGEGAERKKFPAARDTADMVLQFSSHVLCTLYLFHMRHSSNVQGPSHMLGPSRHPEVVQFHSITPGKESPRPPKPSIPVGLRGGL